MNTYYIKALIFIFSFLSLFVRAQERQMTLEQVMEEAYKNNKTLQVTSLEHDAAKIKSKSIAVLPKTSVSGLFGQMNSYRFDENLSISQDIPNPSYIRAQRVLISKEADLLDSRMQVEKNDIKFSIAQSWYRLLYLKELNNILLNEDSILSEFLKAAEAKFKAGESGILEKSTAELHKNQLKQVLYQNEMLIRGELMKIKTYIGIDQSFVPKGSFSLLTVDNDSNIAQNPIFLHLKNRNKVLEAEYQTVKTERKPDFNVGYFVQSLSGPQDVNGIQKNFNALPQFQGIGLGVNLPFFGSKAYKAKLQSIDITKSANEKQIENISWHLEQQWKQTFNEYIFWLDNVDFYKKEAIPNSELILKNATKAYRSGEIDYVEYLQAIRNSLDTQKAYLSAINNLNQNVIMINYLSGK